MIAPGLRWVSRGRQAYNVEVLGTDEAVLMVLASGLPLAVAEAMVRGFNRREATDPLGLVSRVVPGGVVPGVTQNSPKRQKTQASITRSRFRRRGMSPRITRVS